MKDNIVKGPLTASFEITNKCMLRCLHCYNRSGNDLSRNELSDVEILDITNQLADIGLFSFCFCGGEPLTRFDLIIKMCSILKDNCNNLNMVTNGYLMDEQKAIKLKEAGLDLIQISIDGSNAKTHNHMRAVDGAFEKAINAINILNKIGMQVNIAFSPTNFNIEEFPELVKLLSKYENIDTLRVQPLMILGRGSENEILPTEQQYRNLVSFIENYQNDMHKLKIDWGDPVDHIIRFSDSDFVQATFTEIKSDGSLFVSSYLPVSVGNLRRHKFMDYWQQGLYKSWEIPVVREIAQSYTSISTLGQPIKNMPKIFFDKNIEFDLINDNVFENLNKFTMDSLSRR